MLNVLKFIHLLSIVVWVGALIFFTFFVAPSIFKILPKDMAGALVGSIFPKYWAIGYISGILSLSTLIAISFIEKGFPAARLFLLTVMTVVTFYAGLAVATKARELKAQAKVVEDPVKKESIEKEFKKIHFKSSALNMLVLLTGLGLVYVTGRNIRL